uniref:SH3 domain-containing protein 19 n=1 Tax=Jaculus jaculus TaxID=51337 RepID=A0A8C5P466_JACJA
MDTMNTEQSQNSIVSRIKAFEGQTSLEASELAKKPEIIPRTLPPKPAAPSGKPLVAPKPAAAHRVSGDWEAWAENRLRGAPREGLTPYSSPQEAASIPGTKPELPKKPTPGLTRSVNHEISDGGGGGPVTHSPDGTRKVPTPAPRPLLPKKSASSENSTYPSVPPKLVPVPPRLSVASQAKAFRSLGEGPPANPPAAALQSPALEDVDLISFDDDILPSSSGNLAENPVGSDMVLDPFQLPTKTEPAKERAVQPATTRKPTVIRIPAKPGKRLHEDSQSPPPLPAEKPIGNTYSILSGKLSNADKTRNLEPELAGESGGFVRGPPRLPPRPVHGKVTPTPRPPPKGAPERPPPPRLSTTKTSSKKLLFNRSSSDMDLQKKQSHVVSGLSKAKSQVFKTQDPVLPPRPQPGHPLYRKYMLSVPHGIANEDIVSQNPGELSCKRGDVLVILKQTEDNYLECQKGEDTGRVHPSQVKVVTPPEQPLRSRPDPGHTQKPMDGGFPHAVVLHDFPAEEADDLNLTCGETVYLLEKIDAEWYRGKCRNQTGLFPANYVKVIVDIPEGGNGKRESVSSHGKEEIPPKTKNEDSASNSQDLSLSGEWCKALHSFTAETSDDLSFKRGDRILVLERLDSDWYRGRLHDREGTFPAVFVQPCPGTTAYPLSRNQQLFPTPVFLQAGAVITELELVDDDWMSGELLGKSGIFPKNYVQFLHVS